MDKKCILIVDDEEDIVKAIVKRILLHYNNQYKSLIATDGHEALEFMRSQDVSLVLLDVRMRNLDGIQVCQQAAVDQKIHTIPIVITSGYVSAEDCDELKKLGVNHFLNKPYSMDDLFLKVEEILK